MSGDVELSRSGRDAILARAMTRSTQPALEAYRRTPTFDESSIPTGLLRRHATKAGVWARIHVLEGELLFRLLEPATREWRLTPGHIHEVAPEVLHEVEARGSVRFYIEFLRARDPRPIALSSTRSTDAERP